MFNDIVNDPSGEFASIISEDEEGIGLKTIEELMEEGLTKGQAEANIEMFMEEFQRRLSRRLNMSGVNLHERIQ